MAVLSMGGSLVRQSHLTRVAALQKAFAFAHFPWRYIRYEASREHDAYGVSSQTAELLHCQSIHLVSKWTLFDQALTRLEDTLLVCHGKIEPGEFRFDDRLRLVRRSNYTEDYPLEEAILEPDTVIAIKDEESRILAANDNFSYAWGLSKSEVIGKDPLDIWPGQAGGVLIRKNDIEVLGKGPELYREVLHSRSRAFSRFAIRFPLPGPLQIFGRLAEISCDADSALKYPVFQSPNRPSGQESLAARVDSTVMSGSVH